MPTFLHVLLSYKHFKGKLHPSRMIRKESEIPGNITHIFRMNFWSVFNGIAEIDFTETLVRYLDWNATIGTVALFRTNRDRLTEREGHDHIVYFCLKIETPLKEDEARRAEAPAIELLRERENVIRQTPVHWLLGHLESDHVGHSAFIADTPNIFTEDLSCVAAFFFYAWILTLRVERTQSEMNISPNLGVITQSSNEIIAQRVRLLNIERYFLSIDRTNIEFLKNVCVKLVNKYRLKERHERAAQLHLSFEHHMDNTEKALQSRRFANLTNMIAILTVISIPLAALQMLFGINLTSSIFREWRTIVGNHVVLASIGIAIATAVVPLLVLKMFDIAKSAIRRRRNF